jgi:hypothetical protein
VGLFDFLKGKGSTKNKEPAAAERPLDKKIAGPAKVVADKRAQTYDRLEALQALVAMKSPDAARALLKRFTFSIDPSITDQEEKELAFEGIVDAGRASDHKERVVDATIEFCAKADQLTWALKVLRELLDDDEFVAEASDLLSKYDTEYARNVEPKVQLITALEDVKNELARAAVEPFLEDVNETVRFHAVQTTFAQDGDASLPTLVKLLEAEESVRIKNKVAQGMLEHGWALPEALREPVRKALRDTEGYRVDGSGKVTR